MIWKYKHGNVLIMDLESPTQNEAKYIEEEYQIPEYFSKKIIIKDYMPILESGEGFIFMSFIVPFINGNVGLSFLSGDNILVISHKKKLEPILKYYQDLEIDLSLNKINIDGVNSDRIMVNLISKIFEHKIKYLEKIKFILKNNMENKNGSYIDLSDFLNKYEINLSLSKDIIKELGSVLKLEKVLDIHSSIVKLEEEIKVYKKINTSIYLDQMKEKSIKNKIKKNFLIFVLLVFIIMLIYLIWL
ncbi:TPA: hypothetical protein DIC38_02795 [Candidatus Nomurabacteria bacterium]|nr:MAG: hypothetical protein O210_OD1C00001G0226 [Parcubacteria bacterium RAAC4_OD1_1]HCY26581.1 hypothetical protein [Candidatus Nomurabacteria bacterium]